MMLYDLFGCFIFLIFCNEYYIYFVAFTKDNILLCECDIVHNSVLYLKGDNTYKLENR